MNTRHRLSCLVAIGCMSLALPAAAQTTYYWAPTGTFDAGGVGTWSAANLWRTGSSTGAQGSYTNATDATAIIGGTSTTAYTITVSGPVQVNTIRLDASTGSGKVVTINNNGGGRTIEFAGTSPTIYGTPGRTLQFSTGNTGTYTMASGTLTFDGGGTITMAGRYRPADGTSILVTNTTYANFSVGGGFTDGGSATPKSPTTTIINSGTLGTLGSNLTSVFTLGTAGAGGGVWNVGASTAGGIRPGFSVTVGGTSKSSITASAGTFLIIPTATTAPYQFTVNSTGDASGVDLDFQPSWRGGSLQKLGAGTMRAVSGTFNFNNSTTGTFVNTGTTMLVSEGKFINESVIGSITNVAGGLLTTTSTAGTFDQVNVTSGTFEVARSSGLFATLSGTTYTSGNGALNLRGGTLRYVGVDTDYSDRMGNLGGVASTIDTNGQDVTFATGLSGTGGLVKSGSGALVLTAAGSYSGATTLSQGTLRGGNDGAFGSGGLVLTGGTLASDSATARSFSNGVSIGGDVAFGDGTGTGALAFSGTVGLGEQTRTLTTTVSTTFAGAVSNGSITKAGAATLSLTNASNSLTALTANAGTVSIGASMSVTGLGGSGGALNLAAGTLTFNQAASGTVSLPFSGGGGFTKTGNNLLSLTGASGDYAGTLTVSAGTLAANGTLGGGVSVSSGATLGGSGTVGTVSITSGATLSPGNSPGVLTTGNMTWAGGGNYNWQLFDQTLAAGTGYDTISSSGSLTINATSGNKFNVNLWTLSGTNPDTNGFATFNSTESGSFTLGTFAGGFSGFAADAFNIVTTAANGTGGFFNSTTNGAFSIATSGNSLLLVYTYAPPSGIYDYTAGTGNWNTAGNWAGSTVPTGTAAITLSGPGGTSTNDVTLDEVSSLVFTGAAGAYTVAGNAIPLGAGGIANDSTVGQTISAPVALAASGTFTANTANLTFSGTVDIAGNDLTVAGVRTTSFGVITGSGAFSKIDSGTATLTAANATVGSFTIAAGSLAGSGTLTAATYALTGGEVSADLGAGTLTADSGAATLNGTSGAGTVTIGGGALATGGANTLSDAAAVTISAGSLTLGGDDTVGSFAISGGSLAGSATLTAATYALGGGTVAGNLGAGVLTVTANSSLNGTSNATTVNLDAGVLTLGSAGRFTASAVAVTGSSGGSLSLGGNESIGSLAGEVNVALGSATLTTGDANTSTSYSGALSGAGGLTKVGSGTFTLAAANTYGGATTVTAGVLALGVSDALSGSTAVTIGGGGLDLSSFSPTVGGFTITSGSLTGAGTLTAPSYGLAGGTVLANLGSGTVTVTGNSALDGTSAATAVNLNAGTLTLASGGRFTTPTVAVTGSAGGALVLGGNETIGSLAGAANVNLGSATLTIGAANTDSTFSGALSGAGSLTKIGTGTLALAAANSHAGGTLVSGSGALRITHADALGTGTLTLSGSSARELFPILQIGPGLTVSSPINISLASSFRNNIEVISGSSALTGPITYDGASTSGQIFLSGGTFSIQGNVTGVGDRISLRNSAANTLGVISGTVNLGSNGTLEIGSSNVNWRIDSTGNTWGSTQLVGTGTLSIGANNALSTSAVLSHSNPNIATNAATLNLNGFNQTVAGIAVASSTTRILVTNQSASSDSTLTLAGLTTSATFSGVLADGTTRTLALVMNSAGREQVLNGTNTYSGATTITAGTLTLGRSSGLSSTSAVTIDGGVLNLATFAANSAGFTLTSGTLLGTGTLTSAAGYDVRAGTVAASLAGGVGLTKSTSGTVTLSTSNSFTGGAAVNAGTLVAGNVEAFGSGTVSIGTAGTLDLGSLAVTNAVTNAGGTLLNAGNYGGTQTLSGAATFGALGGTLAVASGGAATLDGALSGSMSIAAGGTATLSNTGSLAQATLTNDGRFVIDRTGSTSFGTLLVGSGELVKLGSGTVSLTSLSSFTGTTSVNAGDLRIDGAVGGDVNVLAGAILGGSGQFADLLGAGLVAPGNSPGILTGTGAVDPTGGLDFAFEISGTLPLWSNATASVNDVLRITDPTAPFTAALATGVNTVSVYLDVPTLTEGTEYLGGFFTDRTTGLLADVQNADWVFYVSGTGGGGVTYNGINYYALNDWLASPQNTGGVTGISVAVRTVASADFAGGNVTNGQVTSFIVVPEPATVAGGLIGLAAAAVLARRRRKVRRDPAKADA